MTELQLQAIVNQQGIEGTGESNLDMTVCLGKNGQHFLTFHNIYKMYTSRLKMRNFMLYF